MGLLYMPIDRSFLGIWCFAVLLGVLKKGSIEFVRELPQRKKDVILRLGYGLLNKVALLFPYNFGQEKLIHLVI